MSLPAIEPRRAAKPLSRAQLKHLLWLYEAGSVAPDRAVTLGSLSRQARALDIGVLCGHGLALKTTKPVRYWLTAAGVARAEAEKAGHDPRSAALKVA